MRPIETQIDINNIAVDSITQNSNSVDSSVYILKNDVSIDTLKLENLNEVFGNSVNSVSIDFPKNYNNSIPMMPIPFSIVLILLLLWVLVIRNFKPEINRLIRAFFHYNLIKRVDENKSIHMTNYLNYSFFMSVLVFCTLFYIILFNKVLDINIFNLNVFLYAYLSIFFIYILRWLFTQFYKKIIGAIRVRRLLIFQKVYSSFIFLIFTPITVIFLLFNFSKSFITIVFSILILILIFSYFGFLAKFFSREKFHFNQFFLYLCLVELLPLLLMGILFLA